MPEVLTPPGYRAVLIGSAATIEEMTTFTPMEEGTAEGSLMLMRLDFTDFPTGDALAELESRLQDAGVERWSGYPYIVYADASAPRVYLAWQKGIAWLPIIIGILAVTALPALLGGIIWLLLPQAVKDLINMLIGMGMMMLMIWLMTTLIKPLTAPERPKRVEGAAA